MSTLQLMVRVGCRLNYSLPAAVPAFFKLKPRIALEQFVMQEMLSFGIGAECEEFVDAHENVLHRLLLPRGPVEVRHDAIIAVPAHADDHDQQDDRPISPLALPLGPLGYTLPSRYCDSDKLSNFAWSKFGGLTVGHGQVRAVCNWIHDNIEYRYGSGHSHLSASDIVNRGYGVCRDFAHVGIALCRALNLPARYVSGHLPDIGFIDPGSSMDFHAYFEVYLGGKWFAYDPRYNVPRIGRIAVARGFDAVDGAFATIYGAGTLTNFEVWAYQVPAGTVVVGDPIDLSVRLDGGMTVRYG
jgi:transglutaminase-like putative cysteine protease